MIEEVLTDDAISHRQGAQTDEEPAEVEEDKEYPRADILNRFLAKFIDFLIAGTFATLIAPPIGSLAALTYSFIADGFFDGRSPGKKLIGLRVINLKTGDPCNFKDSIMRNIPIGLTVLFALIPILGWILFITVGTVMIMFESYLIYSDNGGIRIGDILADTQVVNQDR